MKKLFFKIAHRSVSILAQFIAKIRSPWIRKNIEYSDVDLIQKCHLELGDFIVTRTNGELSTLILPGFYKHLAIYIGDGYIIDATTHGVQVRYLADLCMKADCVAIMRPTYKHELEVSKVIDFCYKQLGKDYDFEFELLDNDKFFCSELGMKALNYAKSMEYIEPRLTMDIPTFTPQDCRLAIKKFTLIWEKLDK